MIDTAKTSASQRTIEIYNADLLVTVCVAKQYCTIGVDLGQKGRAFDSSLVARNESRVKQRY